jgi:hypothetical protein
MKSRPGQALRNIAVAFAGHLPPVRTALAKTLTELDLLKREVLPCLG